MNLTGIIISSLTLIVTIITLYWFIQDRGKQNKKEFENLIYENIKSISVYLIDIIKIREAKKFIELNDIKNAEKEFTEGFRYLEIYGKTHNLKYLYQFGVTNSIHQDINKNSFSYHFYDLNDSYQKYRASMLNKSLLDNDNAKLKKYYEYFTEYLTIALEFANSVLAKNKKPKNKKVQEYYNKISVLVKKCKDAKLYE